VSSYFTKENHGVVKDPRVEIVHDDARHYLLTTREHFDVIASDLTDPWMKGAAALYTREFYALAKSHLNPGGVVTQWLAFYETSVDAKKSELATFFGVFPRGLVFASGSGSRADAILFGAAEPQPIDPDKIQRQLDSSEYRRVRESLADVNFFFVTD